jgi:hypothetical protein
MLYQTRFEFVPEGVGTRVTFTFTGTPQSFGSKLTAPLMRLFFNGMMKKLMRQDVEELRDATEGEPARA